MSDAILFLRTLMAPYTDSTLRVEIRSLVPQRATMDGRPPRDWWPLTPVAIEAAAKSGLHWARRFDVYMGVLPRMGRQGGQDAVSCAAWLWCDVDGGSDGPEGAWCLLDRAGMPAPHMAVISGGGAHVYWQLRDVVPLPDNAARQAFKAILRRVVLKIGRGRVSELGNYGDSLYRGSNPELIPDPPHADESAAEPARILRLPDTWNWKRTDEPRAVRLAHLDPEAVAYTLEAWDESLPPLPNVDRPARPQSTAYAGDQPLSEGLIRWARTGYPQGKRHKDLVSAAAWLIRDKQVSRDVAEQLLTMKAESSPGLRSIGQDEIRKILRWA